MCFLFSSARRSLAEGQKQDRCSMMPALAGKSVACSAIAWVTPATLAAAEVCGHHMKPGWHRCCVLVSLIVPGVVDLYSSILGFRRGPAAAFRQWGNEHGSAERLEQRVTTAVVGADHPG